MDIKQDLQACAAITIGKDMTLRDFAQGAWRSKYTRNPFACVSYGSI